MAASVVRAKTGEPLSGFKVEARDGRWTVAEALTDEEGLARLELPPGAYLLNAYREASRSRSSRSRAPVTVAAGGESEARLEVEHMVAVKGRILSRPGVGEESLSVTAVFLGEDSQGGGNRSAGVDGKGGFNLKLPPGRYLLLVSHARSGSTDAIASMEIEALEAGSPLSVAIPIEPRMPAVLELAILDSAGSPPPGTSASLIRSRAGTQAAGGSAGEAGLVALEAFPGTFDLEVKAPGRRTARVPGLTLREGERKELEIRLEGPLEPGSSEDLESFFREDSLAALEEAMPLGVFLALLRDLARGEVILGPGVEESGALEHGLLEGGRVGAPHEVLRSALSAHGLRAEIRGSQLRVVEN